MDHATIRKLIAFNVSMCGLFFCSGMIFGMIAELDLRNGLYVRDYYGKHPQIQLNGQLSENCTLVEENDALLRIKKDNMVLKVIQSKKDYIVSFDKRLENGVAVFYAVRNTRVYVENPPWDEKKIVISNEQFETISKTRHFGHSHTLVYGIDKDSNIYKITHTTKNGQVIHKGGQQNNYNSIVYAVVGLVAVMAALLSYVNNGFGVK